MTCAHGKAFAGIAPLRMYGSWPGTKRQLPARAVRQLYLWHWDHMQCVLARPSDYIIHWSSWYVALCQLCDDHGLQRPATPLEVAYGGTK